MVAPVLAREGARIGGVTTTTAAFTCRTNDDGHKLSVDVSLHSNFTPLAGTVTEGDLTAANNYQATCYVSGLEPGRRYYWRIVAKDNSGTPLETRGTEPLHANSFRTISDKADRVWKVGATGCFLGAHQGVNVTRARQASDVARNIIGLNLDALLIQGDIYYSDVSTTRLANGSTDPTNITWDDGVDAYAPNAWFAQVGSGTKTVDDSTKARHRTNFITTLDGPIHQGQPCSLGHVMAAIPEWVMWDDHDLAWDNCADLDGSESPLTTAEATCLANGYETAHEMFMDLNRDFILQESGRSAPSAFGDAEYYYVDMPPARFLVLDGRSYRDGRGNTDVNSQTDGQWDKALLGKDQLNWIKWHIDNNPQQYLIICSPLALDGDHGWYATNSTNWESHKGFSFERDDMLNYIWSNGHPTRTAFLTADSHNGHVAAYRGPNGDRPPIYEIMASNGGWLPSYHGYTTGFSSKIIRPDEEACASGWGGVPEYISSGFNNLAVVEGGPQGLTIKMIETCASGFNTHYQDTRMTGSRVVWSRRLA